MKRLERMALWALLSYGLCGCTRTSEVKTDTAATVAETRHEAEKSHEVTTVQQGPETITTTVEEWATGPEKATAPEGAVGPVRVALNHAPPTEDLTMPPQAMLVKRTVTVDQRGPVATHVETDSTEHARTAVTATAATHSDATRSTRLFPGWGWYALLALALAVAGAYVAWRAKVFTL